MRVLSNAPRFKHNLIHESNKQVKNEKSRQMSMTDHLNKSRRRIPTKSKKCIDVHAALNEKSGEIRDI
jgi:hypothetical protein